MGEFQFGKDHTKCPTCGYCIHAHAENPKVKALCDAVGAGALPNPNTVKSPGDMKKFLHSLAQLSAGQKGNPFAMSTAGFVKSLNPASATMYLPAQVRATNTEAIKFQGEGNMEIEVFADGKIVNWLKAQPATKPSVAGTGVMYTACQVVAHDKKDPKVADFKGPVRVQINGPALNRDWGAEFVVDHPKLLAWAEQFSEYLKGKESQKEAAASGQSLLAEEETDHDPEPDDEP